MSDVLDFVKQDKTKIIHDFAQEQGHGLRSKHHGIYHGNSRRSVPEKLKTVLRQPLKK